MKYHCLVLTVLSLAFPLTQATASGPISDMMLMAELPGLRLCPGECSDFAPTISDGVSPFMYQWSTGETDSLINICPTDEQTRYDLTITDATGAMTELTNYVVVAPTSRTPIPSVTTPNCIGEDVYFSHLNWGWAPTYRWLGPNGFSSTDKDFIIENATADQGGNYSLSLTYFDRCHTDTVEIEVQVLDQGPSATCESLNNCQFACNTLEFFKLRGTTDEAVADIPKSKICGNEGEDVNTQWIGFVAQGGAHTLNFRALNCTSGGGLRYGLYDACDLDNLIACTEECTMEAFQVSSNILVPGQEYYLYIDGCGSNICQFTTSIDGNMTLGTCNDYVPMSQMTEWEVVSGGFGGSSSSWLYYDGDTTVAGTTYRKIASTANSQVSLIREDKDARKVYIRINAGGDRLLYDFDLEVGDVYVDPTYNNAWTLEKITRIQSHIGPLKRFTFGLPNFGLKLIYDEGVGGTILTFPAHVLISDPVFGRAQVYAGCQQVFGIQEAINEVRSTRDTSSVSVCEGEILQGYSSTGIYSDTTAVDGGCLSINVLDLTVIPASYTEIDTTICSGKSYLGFDSTGNYQEILPAANGCDSIINIDLTISAPSQTTEQVTLCDGDSLSISNLLQDDQGNYYTIDLDSSECIVHTLFSIDTIFLQDDLVIDTTICEGQILEIDLVDTTFASAGTYTFPLEFINGCTSRFLVIELQILPNNDPACATNTGHIEDIDFEMFPNPTSGAVTVISGEPITLITIFDSSSRLVSKHNLSTTESIIDLSQLKQGMYIVKAQVGDETVIKRLVKVDQQ